MPYGLWMRTEPLHGAGTAAHEEFLVILDNLLSFSNVRRPHLRTSLRGTWFRHRRLLFGLTSAFRFEVLKSFPTRKQVMTALFQVYIGFKLTVGCGSFGFSNSVRMRGSVAGARAPTILLSS